MGVSYKGWRKRLIIFLFTAPTMIGVTILSLYPMLYNVFISLTNRSRFHYKPPEDIWHCDPKTLQHYCWQQPSSGTIQGDSFRARAWVEPERGRAAAGGPWALAALLSLPFPSGWPGFHSGRVGPLVTGWPGGRCSRGRKSSRLPRPRPGPEPLGYLCGWGAEFRGFSGRAQGGGLGFPCGFLWGFGKGAQLEGAEFQRAFPFQAGIGPRPETFSFPFRLELVSPHQPFFPFPLTGWAFGAPLAISPLFLFFPLPFPGGLGISPWGRPFQFSSKTNPATIPRGKRGGGPWGGGTALASNSFSPGWGAPVPLFPLTVSTRGAFQFLGQVSFSFPGNPEARGNGFQPQGGLPQGSFRGFPRGALSLGFGRKPPLLGAPFRGARRDIYSTIFFGG